MAGQPRRLIEVQHGAAAKKSHGNLGIVWNKNRTTMEGTKSDGILACKSLQSEPPDQNSYIYIYYFFCFVWVWDAHQVFVRFSNDLNTT